MGAYDPYGRRDATVHILEYKSATVERRNRKDDKRFDELSGIFCFW